MKNYPHKVVTTIHNPDRQVVLTEEYGQTALCCPVCSSGFSHVVGVFTLLGGDESEGLYHGSYLVARESNESRDGLAVRLRGECGHRWEVVFQQHKGISEVRINVLENSPADGNGFVQHFPREGRS